MYAPRCPVNVSDAEERNPAGESRSCPVYSEARASALVTGLRAILELSEFIPATTCCFVSTSYITRSEELVSMSWMISTRSWPPLRLPNAAAAQLTMWLRGGLVLCGSPAKWCRLSPSRFPHESVARAYAGIMPGAGVLPVLFYPPPTRKGQVPDRSFRRHGDLGACCWARDRSQR